MPGMDGFEVCRRIKKDSDIKDIPVIFLSSIFRWEDSVEKCLKFGGIDFIGKPVRMREVRERAVAVLKQKCLERENDRLIRLNRLLSDKISRLEKSIGEMNREKQLSEKDDEMTERYKSVCHAVAHNLKGEFFHIGSSVDEIRELTENIPEADEECDMIERSIEYASHALQKLLDFLEVGIPREYPVEIGELLERIETMVRPRLPSSLRLKIQAGTDILRQTVYTDLDQLKMVLVEMINNAVNALHSTGGTIGLVVEKRGDCFALSVEDNGSGVPENVKKDLFQKQVPSGKGTGLGLYLGKKVMNVLGGDLFLEFSSDKGSRFTVVVPEKRDERKS
jgi:signal transduction histidine kinase